jgi:hypothetical protein
MDANKPDFDGDAVPRAVEYLVRLAIRWVLYLIGVALLIVAIVAAGLKSFAGQVFVVGGVALLISGWLCAPRRERSRPTNP